MTQIVKIIIYSISFPIHILPRFARQFLGELIGFMWFDVLRVRRQSTIENVMIAYPEMSRQEATKVARSSLKHVGYNVIELFSFPFLSKKSVLDQFEIEGKEHMDKALTDGKGVFLMSAHVANGDMGMAGLSHMGFPMHVISKIFKTKALNDFWFEARNKQGIRMIPPRRSSYEILKCLKNNQVVVFVLDQYTGPPNGIVTDFFGVKTGTAFGLALLAERAGAPVIPAYEYRKSFGKNVIVVGEPVIFEPKESKEETLRHNTQKYCDVIEKIVRRHPEQWMWVHRRFKPAWTTDEDGTTHLLPPTKPLTH